MMEFFLIIGFDRSSVSSRGNVSFEAPNVELPNNQDGPNGYQHVDIRGQIEEKVEEESALDPEILEMKKKR